EPALVAHVERSFFLVILDGIPVPLDRHDLMATRALVHALAHAVDATDEIPSLALHPVEDELHRTETNFARLRSRTRSFSSTYNSISGWHSGDTTRP